MLNPDTLLCQDFSVLCDLCIFAASDKQQRDMKKEVVNLARAAEKEFNKNYKSDRSDLFKTCNMSFKTSDCQVNTRGGETTVVAKIDSKDFEKILEMNMSNVISFFENKGFKIEKK